ncbi:MAG: hypothetical protein QM666_07365 [Acinetobacter sp.]
MMNDDFTKQVTNKLDELAQIHKNKGLVIQQVIQEVHNAREKRNNRWKVSAFALAATLAGFVVLPNAINLSTQNKSEAVVNSSTAKLSPQMVEDLEMVMVFGEEKSAHGS